MSLNYKNSAMAISLALLLLVVKGAENDGVVKADEECNKRLVKVTQGLAGAMPSGTPIHSVQVSNECPDCSVAGIHLSCGSFASEKLILPNIFRRVGDGDCLVNNGLPIGVGHVVSFEYANTQTFPLGVSSLQCLE